MPNLFEYEGELIAEQPELRYWRFDERRGWVAFLDHLRVWHDSDKIDEDRAMDLIQTRRNPDTGLNFSFEQARAKLVNLAALK